MQQNLRNSNKEADKLQSSIKHALHETEMRNAELAQKHEESLLHSREITVSVQDSLARIRDEDVAGVVVALAGLQTELVR